MSQALVLLKKCVKISLIVVLNVITTGNHVWDQKEIMNFINKENRLLRPKNLFEPAPGNGFEIYTIQKI